LADRVFLYAESARVAPFMAPATSRYGLGTPADDVVLHAVATAPPKTVSDILGPDLPTRVVTARRLTAVPVDATRRWLCTR